MTKPTAEQTKAVVGVVLAVRDAIKELGQVPSGHLYAQLMSYMSLELYHQVIGVLIASKMVKEQNHLLTWVG